MIAEMATTMAPPVASPPGGNRTIEMLASFGVQLVEGRLRFSDQFQANTAYIHHSTVPVAIVAMAQISTGFALNSFPKVRLADLIAKRPSMDGPEAIALGAVCGADISRTMWPTSPAPAFRDHLDYVIMRYGLAVWFGRDERTACNGITVRPRGIDYRTDKVIDADMKAWRSEYKALTPELQMMVATILWLYCGGHDKVWMSRLPCSWHAAEAVDTLKGVGMLADWGRLVALYPGW